MDNLFDDHIVALAAHHCRGSRDASDGAAAACAAALAKALVVTANAVGHDARARTPFAVHARAAGLRYDGGKLDDCTAVVGVVTGVAPAAPPKAKL